MSMNYDVAGQALPLRWKERFFAIWTVQKLSWVGSAAAHWRILTMHLVAQALANVLIRPSGLRPKPEAWATNLASWW